MDYKGCKFGRLTVLDTFIDKKWVGGKTNKFKSKTVATCQCVCGNVRNVPMNSLKTGNTKSCGCHNRDTLIKRNYKHGFGKHPLKSTYYSMLRRCEDEEHESYIHYGGRGIKVCDEWKNDIGSFVRWCESNGYEKGKQLDREDNDGDYSPNNCRFITVDENHRNMRSNVKYGDKCLKDFIADLSKEFGVSTSTLTYRYYRMINNGIVPNKDNLINYKQVKNK